MKAVTTNEPPIYRIAVPNPYFESDVNVWIIAGRPLTMIDTGIGTPEALRALEEGLQKHGFHLEEVEQVILTHKHPDHMGLAKVVGERSGASVFVHQEDWPDVTHFQERREHFLRVTLERLKDWGAPESEVDALKQALTLAGGLARSAPAEPLREGQRLVAGEGEIEVLHMPGHTQGSICLRYHDFLFSGDHLLPDYTPNVGAGDLERSGMLGRFLDSLSRLLSLQDGQLLVLPGHGQSIQDPVSRIQHILQHHRERDQAILDALRTGPPRSVYEIAQALFGQLKSFHIVLGAGEVNAHLELLEEKGLVFRSRRGYVLA
ncbi:MAG: MBL fold metallo-hydrolase [Acidobacteriota bacterium]